MINALSIIPVKTASCPEMGDYAIAKKMNVKWGSQKRGDIVLFDFNHNGTSDHIGIVTYVGNGYIETVEGNTGSGSDTNGGEVQKRTRYKNQVNYFVRPKYNTQVTADMVISTALAEVGIKESPANSNKVKYNQWFYGSNTSAFWCCTFVCWVFAHVKTDIKPVEKPKDKYGYILPEPTLKRGNSGDRVRELQRFLNWYCNAKLIFDGKFGAKTEEKLKIFQMTEGLSADGIYGNNSYRKALAYTNQTVNGRTLIKELKAETSLELMTSMVGQSLAVVNASRRAVFYSTRDGKRQQGKYYTDRDKTAEIGNFTSLGHANGATIKGTQFYVCSYYGGKNTKKVTIIDDKLKRVGSFNLPVAVSGIAWDSKKGVLIGSKGKTIYIFNGNKKVKSKFTLKFADGTPQDIMAYGGYIYVCRSYVRGSISCIDVYDYSGTYTGSFTINANELESCDVDENGYIHFITWNKARLVKTGVRVL